MRATPRPGLAAGVAAAGLVLILVGQLTVNRARIEDDLGERSRAALTGAGFGAVAVSVSGRDVTLLDAPVRAADAERASRLVAELDGVRVVTLQRSVAELAPSPAPRVTPSPTPNATPDATPSRTASPTPEPSAEPTPSASPGATGSLPAAEVARRLRALPRIEFTSTLVGLSPTGRETVRRAAAVLQRNRDVLVRVEGHTDTFGTDQVNRELSQARASVVRDALVAEGVAADRLRVVGYGESRPLVVERSAADGAVNRRVVLTVLR